MASHSCMSLYPLSLVLRIFSPLALVLFNKCSNILLSQESASSRKPSSLVVTKSSPSVFQKAFVSSSYLPLTPVGLIPKH